MTRIITCLTGIITCLTSICISILLIIYLMFSYRATTFQMPRTLTGFQLHAVIPVLVCAPNTITDPSLCHSTLIILKEVIFNINMIICLFIWTLIHLLVHVIILSIHHFMFYQSILMLTFTLYFQLFEMVKGMPLFMLNNGLYKMLCQMIALTLECSLSRYMHETP